MKACRSAAGLPYLALCLVLTACTGTSGPPPQSTSPGSSGTSPAPAVAVPAPSASASAVPVPTVQERLDLQLDIPWAAVFLPDGTAIISERDSALLKTVRDGKATTLGEVPGVVPAGEGGLLGLALSPHFDADRYLYAYLTAQQDNRVVRLTVEGNAGGSLAIGQPQTVFTGIPKAGTHNGGRIRFGPDGFLYVGTGDARAASSPRTPTHWAARSFGSVPTEAPPPATRSATPSTAWGTGTSRDWPGMNPAGCGPASSGPTWTTS